MFTPLYCALSLTHNQKHSVKHDGGWIPRGVYTGRIINRGRQEGNKNLGDPVLPDPDRYEGPPVNYDIEME
jgi:hypothetical protein